MMKLVQFIVAAFVLIFVVAVPTVMALPPSQFPCFGSAGCPEPVNPEPDEYYAIQCTTNTIWVWRTIPILAFVNGIPFFDVEALSDGESLVVTLPNEVTVNRNGDTVTVSGANGNFAPQPGEKSFSWSECVERNGGLSELPTFGEELTNEEICLSLDTEQEQVDCLNALIPPTPTPIPQDCDDPLFLNTHPIECSRMPCPDDSTIIVVDLDDCPEYDAIDRFIQFINDLIEYYCGISLQASAVIFAFVAFRTRRKRK